MYGIFTYIYHKFKPNVGKYSIHGWYGICVFFPPEDDGSLFFFPGEDGWGEHQLTAFVAHV